MNWGKLAGDVLGGVEIAGGIATGNPAMAAKGGATIGVANKPSAKLTTAPVFGGGRTAPPVVGPSPSLASSKATDQARVNAMHPGMGGYIE